MEVIYVIESSRDYPKYLSRLNVDLEADYNGFIEKNVVPWL